MYQCDFRITAEFFSCYLVTRKQREWRRKKGQAEETCHPSNSVLLWVARDSSDVEGSLWFRPDPCQHYNRFLVFGRTGKWDPAQGCSPLLQKPYVSRCLASMDYRSHIWAAHGDRRFPSTKSRILLEPRRAVENLLLSKPLSGRSC